MPRQPRVYSKTDIYHVMIRGINKEKIFTKGIYKSKLLNIIQEISEEVDFNLIAYCVMNNHLHLLIKAGNYELTKFMKKLNKSVVLGDVDRMEQIIRNLLKNAINATGNGSINVIIETYNDEVQLTIKDNGIGISPDELPHIWDRFYSVKNQRNTDLEIKGTGLGLVIVKKLVQLQDGKIDVESQPGKGTEFRLSFPLFTIDSGLAIT